RGERVLDVAFKSDLVGMVMLAPLANGAASHAAYTVFEVAVFGLVALWLVKLIVAGHWMPFAIPVRISALLSALALLIGLQVVPLPSSLLSAISPHTFQLYSRTLTGWPNSTPYSEVVQRTGSSTNEAQPLIGSEIDNWRTISLAPSVTAKALLNFLGYVSIFFVLLLYPFAGSESGMSESRFPH